MITKEELRDIARFSGSKPHQQEKHYAQTIILKSIYSTITDELVFKGGTCLLFFYGLNRFSEDLDFTMVKEADIQKIVSNIKKDLENLGINCRISKVEENKSSVSFKIGVDGPLFHKEIERCFVRIDISKREKVDQQQLAELKSLYKEIIGFSVVIMSETEILAEKIRALITRNQARDLYDIYFLLKKRVNIDQGLINQKLGYYNKRLNKKELVESIKNKSGIWRSELNSLIMGSLPDFKEVSGYVLKSFRAVDMRLCKNNLGWQRKP